MFKQKTAPFPLEYEFVAMSQPYAQEIAYEWKYTGKYSFYNIYKDKEEVERFLKPESWGNIFAAINVETKELIGFTSYTFENEVMWIGFGLKPNYTGKGHGEQFVRSAIEFGIEHYHYEDSKVLLSVAKFNKRATKLYEKVGFKAIESKEIFVNGKLYPFTIMGIPV